MSTYKSQYRNRSSKTLAASRSLLIPTAIKESTPTLASPYTFSSSMSINCNRIPRGGCPRIFLPNRHYLPRRKVQRFTWNPRGYRLTLKYLFFNKPLVGGCRRGNPADFLSHGRADIIPINHVCRRKYKGITA